MRYTAPALILLCLIGVSVARAGPLAYALCQTGCNTAAVACYGAAGATFGTVTAGAGIPLAVVGCNASLGACMAACAALALSPTP
jgi:hypothetical protein